ncbi:MAG: hypothetical protein A2Y34_03935 [Spirochaetes bacterium GWC1_27_15]|nr:MAG: hypothetical protein A2Y34_03935 [Spirochaetes bacterium GWC1_27_15]
MQTLKDKCPKCRSQLYGDIDSSNKDYIFAIIYCLGCGYEIEVRDEYINSKREDWLDMDEYLGIYDEPHVQIFIKRIFADNQIEAENKFIEYLERKNGRVVFEIYVDLLSNIDFL